jgi:3-hydroxyisobutyrate dehydrogenase-like beta-hydroxyacid dehydrogenase
MIVLPHGGRTEMMINMGDVAVLGTGRMGRAMVERLVQDGHSVSVWNRTPSAAADLAERWGCRHATSPHDAVAGADVVICSFAHGAATESILLDPQFQEALTEDSIVCDMGTSGPDTAQRLAQEFAALRPSFVDGPVSGSVSSVLNRQLLVMASGDSDVVDRLRPVLESFAKMVIYVGPAGQGQKMKLAVNLVLYALNSAIAEGMALATSAGIDRDNAYEVLANSSVAAPYLINKQASFLSETSPVTMSLDLVEKDLRLILTMSDLNNLTLPVLHGVLGEVTQSVDSGFGLADMADLYPYLMGWEKPQRD